MLYIIDVIIHTYYITIKRKIEGLKMEKAAVCRGDENTRREARRRGESITPSSLSAE